jgi:hypothetical protein
MSDAIKFPTLRPRRPPVQGSDHLAEIATVPMQVSLSLQSLAGHYLKIAALHGGDRSEARRLIIAELDEIDNPNGECLE